MFESKYLQKRIDVDTYSRNRVPELCSARRSECASVRVNKWHQEIIYLVFVQRDMSLRYEIFTCLSIFVWFVDAHYVRGEGYKHITIYHVNESIYVGSSIFRGDRDVCSSRRVPTYMPLDRHRHRAAARGVTRASSTATGDSWRVRVVSSRRGRRTPRSGASSELAISIALGIASSAITSTRRPSAIAESSSKGGQ